MIFQNNQQKLSIIVIYIGKQTTSNHPKRISSRPIQVSSFRPIAKSEARKIKKEKGKLAEQSSLRNEIGIRIEPRQHPSLISIKEKNPFKDHSSKKRRNEGSRSSTSITKRERKKEKLVLAFPPPPPRFSLRLERTQRRCASLDGFHRGFLYSSLVSNKKKKKKKKEKNIVRSTLYLKK